MAVAYTILALDAAWTVTEPSGVALCRSEEGRWHCLAVAPSYHAFLARAQGEAIDWDQPSFRGSPPDVVALLAAARRLAGTPVDVVAVDIVQAQFVQAYSELN